MTALELSRRIKSGELSVRDALDALYTKIDACDERYRCYTTVSREAADRVIFIDGGRIVEDSEPEEFFAHPKNKRLQDFLSKML